MANKYLARGDAPFGDDIWQLLDERMKSTAKNQLAGRRLKNFQHLETPNHTSGAHRATRTHSGCVTSRGHGRPICVNLRTVA